MMRNFILGLIIGMMIASVTVFAVTNVEASWNNVYNSSTQTIKVIGQ